MKHNTFEPCKDHENGHFGWCLLCEIEQLRKKTQELELKKNQYLVQIERMRERHYMEGKKYSDL